jgi:hypothetical protein
LGLLFWGSIELIGVRIKNINNGEFPAINSRLDEPGLTVYPHNTIIGDELNEQLDYSFGSMKTKNPSSEQKKWKIENEYIISQYERRIINPNLEKCSKKDKVAASAKAMKKAIAKGLAKGAPIVALKINRVHKWTPVTVRSADETLKKHLDANKARFESGVVYFTCEEASAKYGKKDEKTGETVQNLKYVEFNNPVKRGSWSLCGLKSKSRNVGCLPASFYYENAKSKNPRFTGFNPFNVEASEEKAEYGDATTFLGFPLAPGCWPFAFASVVAKDKSAPVAVKCRVHVENINSQVDIPGNYGWVKFGFKGNDYNKK